MEWRQAAQNAGRGLLKDREPRRMLIETGTAEKTNLLSSIDSYLTRHSAEVNRIILSTP